MKKKYIYLVRSVYNGLLFGAFDTKGKAKKYIGNSKDVDVYRVEVK